MDLYLKNKPRYDEYLNALHNYKQFRATYMTPKPKSDYQEEKEEKTKIVSESIQDQPTEIDTSFVKIHPHYREYFKALQDYERFKTK